MSTRNLWGGTAHSGGHRTVRVELADRSYEVAVGHGTVDHLRHLVPTHAHRAVVVTQAGIGVDVDPGVAHEVLTIGDGEDHKTMATVEDLCRRFSRYGLTRGDVVIGVGGGVVTDVAGFAAAVYHRGVAVVHVATTLLGMVDAAIGGKAGVNLPEGKNLVGAFWQPSGVICDLDHLDSLPEREWRCGMGEVIKYRFLGGTGIDPSADLAEAVERCIEIKAKVVAADEREGGRRAILNYGHTLGHALESVGHHDLAHGEAVAIGLVYAAEVAHRLGRINQSRVDEHRTAVVTADLSDRVPAGLADDDLLEAMARDKKAVDGFTMALDGPAGVEVVHGIDPAVLRNALGAVR